LKASLVLLESARQQALEHQALVLATAYRAMRPFFLGIILGDLAMAGIFTIVDFLPQEGLPRRAPVKRHYRQSQLS
jgi:hypothetical protein